MYFKKKNQMKTKLKLYLVLVLTTFGLSACKKDKGLNVSKASTSSLTVINALIDTGSASIQLLPNFQSNVTINYNAANAYGASIPTGYFIEYSSYSGNVPLSLANYPDTAHIIYNLNLNLPIYSIHSLFLTGTITNPDYLLTTDKLPIHKDSTTGIRFVNLSTGSSPVSVDIQGDANGSEVASLVYKGITDFKTYAANSSANDYTFEFRDAASGTLLANYTMPSFNPVDNNGNPSQYLFKNVTIVLFGLPNGSGSAAQQTMLVNNY